MRGLLIVIGSGGHAAVVADALLAHGERVLGFTDADHSRHGLSICGLPVLGDDRVLDEHGPVLKLVNGIGGIGIPASNGLRGRVQRSLEAKGWRFVGVRHPSAVVSPFSRLGDTVQLLANSVIQAGASVGDGCIVNTAAVVEHDVVLEEFVHVSCRAVVCGNVQIGARSHIGAGAVVKQGLVLGSDTVVGAGSVVLKSFAAGATLIGVPARVMKERE